MGNGYPDVQPDDFAKFVADLKELARRVRELERPTGGQLNQTVKTLQDLVDGLINQTDINATGNLAVGGTGSFGGTLTANTGVTSTGVYNNLVSTGAYKVQYVNVNGQMGYVPSSRRYKQDIQTAPSAAEAMLAMRVVTFRYIQAVEALGDQATVEWGVIAEEIHDLGLTWAVDYDEDGAPEGVKYERLFLSAIPVIQDHEDRLRAAGL